MRDDSGKGLRTLGGMLLLSLMAVCAYAGTRQEPARVVNAEIKRSVLESAAYPAAERQVKEKGPKQREEELALLEFVAQNEAADAKTRQDALKQMKEIADRMEIEAQMQACLESMGFADTQTICTGNVLTVIVNQTQMDAEHASTRILDAACGITGFEAGDIKIIIAKK